MNNPNLTWQQQDMIDQVEAALAIEDMSLTNYDKQNLNDIMSGNKTPEQVLKELDEKYNQCCRPV